MSEGIAYQNKDIEFKLLSESFKEKSFEAYGLKLPRIKEVLPTNLPDVSANEMHMDNLFLLKDDTYAIVDYESEYKLSNQIKYVNYIGRVMKRYYKENHKIPDIRIIVIYTGDVEQAESSFRIKCMTLQTEQVFVRNLPTKKIYQTVLHKLEHGEKLTEQELMQLIILPLAEKRPSDKQKRIEQVIELAKRITDEEEQIFVLSGLLVISDKFINRKNAEVIRRELGMTKVGRMLFEDGMKEEKRKITEQLLKEGVSMEIIMKATGLTAEEIGAITRGKS